MSQKQIESFQLSNARINIFEGPVRAGKSFIGLLRWLEFCRSGPKGPLIIVGRTDKTIKRNIISPLQDIVGPDLQYSIGKGEVRLYNRIMYVVGANDERAEGKIRGSEFAGALVDEATLIPESFFKMLLSRLSIADAKLFCSTNPDSPYHWLKTGFIDREKELDAKVFSFNIRDNPSLSEKYITELSREYQGLWHKRYIEGKWVLADGAVYDFFDEDIHVISLPPGNAIYYFVGIDYGTTNPCVFGLFGYNPSLYPNIWLEKEYYFDSTSERKHKSDYDYVRDYMEFSAGFHVKSIYIDPSAASLKAEFIRNGITCLIDADNDVLSGIRFKSQLMTNGTYKVCSQCINTIKEYSQYVWDSKASERGEDKPVKRFDHCFTGNTLISTNKGLVHINDIKKGDFVLTRGGEKSVLDCFERLADVFEYKILGRSFFCTDQHPFLTCRGWIKSSDLILSDILFIECGEPLWKTSSSLTESSIGDTKDLQMLAIETITELTNMTVLEDMDISIEIFGNTIMEKFQKDTIFITKTKIPPTMTLATSSAFLPQTTAKSILNLLITTILRKQGKKQPSGIKVKKADGGIESILEKTPQISLAEKFLECVKTVKNPLLVGKDPHINDFVRINVSLSGEETIVLMMSLSHVKDVVINLQETSTRNQPFAESLVPAHSIGNQKVYNLHVEDYNEYFAENVLVHNCMDAARYALYTHFFNKSISTGMTEQDANHLEQLYAFSYR